MSTPLRGYIGVKEVGFDKNLRSLTQVIGTTTVQTEYVIDVEFTIALDYDALGNLVYVGRAQPGTGKGDAGWQIMKLTYDANGNLTDVQWADGDEQFDNVWNDRAGLSYS